MPAPVAWWTRQRSSRGCPPPRTEIPLWPHGDHLALLEHPAAAVQYGDADPGRVLDRAPPHQGPGPAAAHLDPGRGTGVHAQVGELRSAVLDEQRGRRPVLALQVQVLDHGRGAHGQRDPVQRGDPHRSEPALGPAQGDGVVQHQVLPVGAGPDRQDVPVARDGQCGGQRRIFTGAAPPPRCAAVRHLDRALSHGAVVPPPSYSRCRSDRGRLKPTDLAVPP